MKPMWAALFPEVTTRYEWVGYSDHDILLGNLSAEVAALSAQDEMLTPMAWLSSPSLAAILGGLIYLKTLDLGMSDEKEDFGKTIVQPTPPLTCRVRQECKLTLLTRTAAGTQARSCRMVA